jgi:hypothetical protein
MPRGDWYRSDKRDTVEGHRFLDVRELQRKKVLRPGQLATMTWSRNGEQTGAIQILSSESAITLIYKYQRHGQEWESVRQHISLTWTSAYFGGQRPWFICSNCGKRVAIIYGVGKYFACRKCYDLTYTSCQESDSRFSYFLKNPIGLNGIENLPFYVMKGILNRETREKKRIEKEMERRRSRRKKC